ncbi:UNVERIFIED_CONTAM: hypothetical protein FKN15_005227 [Acipenser sinensis]
MKSTSFSAWGPVIVFDTRAACCFSFSLEKKTQSVLFRLGSGSLGEACGSVRSQLNVLDGSRQLQLRLSS